jgi:predicted nucleotidyltransferase
LNSVEECYRGRNVRVFRLDRTAVVARLRERARDLLERRPDVVEVRLFGSLARDEAHPGSDADLFVIVHDGARPFLDRLPALSKHFTGVGIGCDVIAFSESEARASKARGDTFARAVFGEGLILATREDDGRPASVPDRGATG